MTFHVDTNPGAQTVDAVWIAVLSALLTSAALFGLLAWALA